MEFRTTPEGASTSIAAAGAVAYVGTADGLIQAYRLFGDLAPYLQVRVANNAPVEQLQALPSSGLLLRLAGGVVAAHALDGLRFVARIHPSRATRFHSDASAPTPNVCVCAGHSTAWLYELRAPPALRWRRWDLEEAPCAVHLGAQRAALAAPSACFVLDAATGATLAALPMPLPPPGALASACLVPCAAEPDALLVLLRDEAGAGAGALLRLGEGGDDAAIAALDGALAARAAAAPVDAAGGVGGVALLEGDKLVVLSPALPASGGAVHAWERKLPPLVDDAATEEPSLFSRVAAHRRASNRAADDERAPTTAAAAAAPSGRPAVALHGLHALVAWGDALLCCALGGSGDGDGAAAAWPAARGDLGAPRSHPAAATVAARRDALVARVGTSATPRATPTWAEAEAALAGAGRLASELGAALSDERLLAGGADGGDGAASDDAEVLVFGALHDPLLALLRRTLAAEQQLLRRGARAAVRRGAEACGVPPAAAAVLARADAARPRWAELCAAPTPSAKLAALAAACDALAAVGGEVNAEELLPLVGYSAARAVDGGGAAELALHLAFCERLMPAADARGKVAYCLTTAQAALAALKLEEGDEKEEQCCVA